MVDVLVVVQKEIDASELLTIAKKVGEPIALTYGNSEAEKLTKYFNKVYKIKEDDPNSIFFAIKYLYEKFNPKLVIGMTSKNLKDAYSRLAGIYDLPFATDIFDFNVSGSKVTYKRSFLSGRAIETEEASVPLLLLVSPRKTQRSEGNYNGNIEELSVGNSSNVVIKERKEKVKGGVNLEAAEFIISVGRGFKSKEDLKLAFDLAELVGAQIGCSRPIAADLKWLTEDHWVGLSGKKVAPKVYLMFGISGAPQHLAGITDAKTVIAVNNDKTAPIFKNADYGIVADLYQFIPILTKKLKEKH
ncbi:electron transfer flavoprotein, alpha subunit [Caldisphaera lagunensis DSM 15908]|uniref:Electron transfer flavoprotein, alpha subunit n=1 Tax=Caldisphaera lagunensis (strain DSM 15908 / JCM 11604 / ANMR 0165 / IC-154) TaxID=1056495 RepID=L0AAR1_CALLD|nr:electron transfer flavoprotein subunit alpha/FixB family protein [Caldisphaera lagunensis]AFZ70105.1 electron transfer flavoprotein, alpha subunit [Caldisphaera lagunensis DSM 15908]